MVRVTTLSLALVLGLGAARLDAAPVPAGPTDEQLTEQILALNDLTTLAAMNAKAKAINKEAEKAKRLVKLGAKMQAGPGKPPLKFNAALVLATVARVQRDYESAESLYGWCLDQAYKAKSAERVEQTLEYYLGVLLLRKKYAAMEEVAQRALDTEALGEAEEALLSIKSTALEQLIVAKAKQGEYDAALDRIEQIAALNKNGPTLALLQLKAVVLREAGRFDEVVKAYQDAAKAVDNIAGLNDDSKLRVKRNFRYASTNALVDAKKVDKAIAVLRELVKEDPKNASYANDLGFILADNDKELDEAEKLVRKALELDEEDRTAPKPADDDDATPAGPNAAYLDSLGWILYKKGKFKESLKYLEQAAKDPGDGNHIEIWDHVADAQLALGKTADATQTWEKALKFEDVTPRDAERRKSVLGKLKKLKANPPAAK